MRAYHLLLPRLVAVFISAAICLAWGCSETSRPLDGEEQVSPLSVLPDVLRFEGFATPAQTGVQLWYERIGSEQKGTVVFINGGDANAAMWGDDFIAPFAESGYQVIRYDARDNGRSRWLPWPEDFEVEGWTPDAGPIYPITAHVDDLVGLLDALSIKRAHLVGMSLGGMVAQLTALAHAERVASLVLLSTSPSNSFDPDLAPADPGFFEELASGWRSMGMRSFVQSIAIEPLASAMTDTFLLFAHQPSEEDKIELRQLVDQLLAHAPHNPRSAQGFAIAAVQSWVDRLPQIDVPTLVIHGERDPLFPFEHGRVLAENIPGARLIPIAEFGHGMPISHFEPYLGDMIETIAEGASITQAESRLDLAE